MSNIASVLASLWDAYKQRTPQKLKIIDVFLTYTVLTGVIQFIYMALVGSFPFNSFLSGFISTVGSFILTVSLRMQVTPSNKFETNITEERAFADFLLCNFILHLVVANFMG